MAKYKREMLLQHLTRVGCGGQITEAVFTGAFATTAITPDNLLLVIAPGLPKTNVIFKKDQRVGIAELPKLMRAINVIAGAGNESVNVNMTYEDHRLVLDEEERGVLRLITAQPKTIGTQVTDAVVKKLLAKIPKQDGKGIPLTRALVEGIRATFSLFKATEIELFVGPKGGKVRVGNDNADMAEFPSDDLKASKSYSLLFGQAIVDVMGIITDYSQAMLYLGGPDQFVVVADGGYQYILSPRAKGADA